MEEKTAGAIAIGALAAAITYTTTGLHTETPSRGVPPPDQAIPSRNDTLPYRSVTVFYATDRALAGPSHSGGQASISSLTAMLGLIAISAWLVRRGQKKTAVAIGGLATGAAAIAVFSAPSLISQRGIGESYVSGCRFGTGRGEVTLGYCEVSIPETHRAGEVESLSILRLELSARPDCHVMLQRIVPQDQQEFYEAVRQRVRSAPQRDLFVFVHGYNVSFEFAARRTAQIAHDLKFAGAPIFFSWPSQAKTWRYTVDETNVTWSVPHLKRFLTDLAEQSDAQSINLIAHSMGNRALTQAIHELSYECGQKRQMFQQVILAAPDIDAEVFRDQIGPSLARYSSRVTLYASANDDALAASKLVHGSRRAGESMSRPITVPGVETIDVAMTDLGPLGHSYYGSSPLLLQDLAAILLEARPAAHRPWLAPVNGPGAVYWRLSDVPRTSAWPASDLRRIE